MLDVLNITGTLFAVVAIGYVLAWRGIFDRTALQVMGRFVVTIALPALIFRTLAERDLAEIVMPTYLVAYAIGGLLIIALGYVLARAALGQSPVQATFQAMGMSCPNSGYVGYPLLLLAYPSLATQVLAMNFVVENLILLPLLLTLAERSAGTSSGLRLFAETAKRVLLNPILLALLGGLAVSLSGLKLPYVVSEPLRMLSLTSAGLALVVIGGTLYGLPLRTVRLPVIWAVVGKLLIMPLAVLAGLVVARALGLGPLSDGLRAGLIITAALPPIAIYPLLAQRFGQEEQAALVMLITIPASFVTLSALLLML
ncbi:AEC family transporter [Mesobacterium pallidum]|uniref:AEC family transporter n=1 Tax=Mesobacterium pallidum TaxID=2872037 RepID=UPI001EE1A669|nr:AEC family transporter [Mesobacterium pallidum]